MSIRKTTTLWYELGGSSRQGANCGLHPLIHTLLEFTVAQDVGRGQGNHDRNQRRGDFQCRGIQGIGWVSPLESGGEDFMGKAMYVYSTLAKFKVVQSCQGQDENRIYYVVVYPGVQYCFQKCGRKTNEKKDEDSP
jgi:hypothetical protein